MNDATGTGQKSLRAGAEERVRWFEKQRRTPKRRGGGSRPKPTQCLPKAGGGGGHGCSAGSGSASGDGGGGGARAAAQRRRGMHRNPAVA